MQSTVSLFSGASQALYQRCLSHIFSGFFLLSLTRGSDCIYFTRSSFVCGVFFFSFSFADNCTCRRKNDPIVSIRALRIAAENKRLLSLMIVFPQWRSHSLGLLSSSSKQCKQSVQARTPQLGFHISGAEGHREEEPRLALSDADTSNQSRHQHFR